MKDSWNSESHIVNESKPPVNGDVYDCQARTKTAKNRAVDMMHRMSSSCLISDFLGGRIGGWIDFRPLCWTGLLLRMRVTIGFASGITVAHENSDWICKEGLRAGGRMSRVGTE